MSRRAALAIVLLYFAAAGVDAGLHLNEMPAPGTARFALDRVVVAIDAGLFWPVDSVAAVLLAAR